MIVDTPIGFAPTTEVVAALRSAAQRLADDPEFRDDLVEPPRLLGVEKVTVDGAIVRTTVTASPEARSRIAGELRRRQTEALEEAGLASQILAGRPHEREPGG